VTFERWSCCLWGSRKQNAAELAIRLAERLAQLPCDAHEDLRRVQDER
jgi:hypothetical protein